MNWSLQPRILLDDNPVERFYDLMIDFWLNNTCLVFDEDFELQLPRIFHLLHILPQLLMNVYELLILLLLPGQAWFRLPKLVSEKIK